MSFIGRGVTYPPCALVYEVGGKKEFPPEFIKRVGREYGEEAVADFKLARMKRYDDLKQDGVKDAYWLAHAECATDYPPKDGASNGSVEIASNGEGDGYSNDDFEAHNVPAPSDDKHFTNVVAEDVRWAWTNLKAKGAVGAPSQGAIQLREFARSGSRGMEVLSGMVMKFVPPVKQQTDETVKMQDTGATVLELMDRIGEAIG